MGSWNLGTEIVCRPKEFIRAIIFIRKNGAPYLQSISISDIRSMVMRFLIDNFWHIKDGEFSRQPDRSYAEQTTVIQRTELAGALAGSALFKPRCEVTLYPLVAIRVAENFEAKHFYLLNGADLSLVHLPSGVRTGDIDATRFPPMMNWAGDKRETVSWLGIRSPTHLVSRKMASAILGAVALTPLPRERYSCSGRDMFGGRCTFNNSTFSTTLQTEPHTPPMMNDIVLTAVDGAWLTVLNTLFDASDKPSKSKIRALEYFYRAWFADARERFPILCMSLDSLVGASGNHTSEAINFVKKLVKGVVIDDARLRLLMRVRGAVIHGAAPDVYESEHYETYYVQYETDPIYDLELIVAKCLREAVFGSALKYHAHPNAAIITSMQAQGRLPAKMDEGCIIPGDV